MVNRINYACEQTGLSKRQIRHWEKEGLMYFLKDRKGRIFLQQDIRELLAVKELLDKGFNIFSLKFICEKLGMSFNDIKEFLER